MTFDLAINGRTHAVSVEQIGKSPSRLRVTVDGRARIIDVVARPDGTLSVILDDGVSRAIAVEPGAAPGELALSLRGRSVTVSFNGRRAEHGGASGTSQAAGPHRVLAPMPGRIVRLLAGPGDEVQPRQPLVVVEAMKMENELSSPRAGRVKEVPVAEGMSVEAGRVLVVVE
jgi:biotin carboxyl carrier protein